MLKPRRIAVAAVLALLAIAPAVALGSSASTQANSTTYPDSTGEDPQAPDITSTTVSNDDTGLITFQINVSNRPTLTPDMLYLIFLDTDQNSATGDQQSLFAGPDYVIQLVPGEADLFQWNGSDYVAASSQASLTFSYASTGPTIRINDTDLAKTKAFNFAVLAVSGITTDAQGNSDFTNIHRDASPDPGHGAFTYQVQIKVSLSVVAFTTSPKPVRAGKPFSVGLAANESDTGAGVQQGSVTCVARIAGKSLRLRSKGIVNGVAICQWTVPKTATGKRVSGTITLLVQDAQISKTFSLKVA